MREPCASAATRSGRSRPSTALSAERRSPVQLDDLAPSSRSTVATDAESRSTTSDAPIIAARISIAATSGSPARAASTGVAPRRARRGRRAENVSPAPVGSTAPVDGRRRDRAATSAVTTTRAARAEREHDLGHAERPQRRGVEPAREDRGLLLVQLQHGEVRRAIARSTSASATSGPSAGDPHEPLRVERAGGGRRARARRASRAGSPSAEARRRSTQSASPSGPEPSRDVPGGPRVADRVVPHDAVVALVVEAERRRLRRRRRRSTGRPERLERREQGGSRRPARSAHGDRDVGAECARGPGRVEDAAAGARRRAGDDVDGTGSR